MSEIFKLMKSSTLFSREEFVGLKEDAAKAGISFNRLCSKTVDFAGTSVTVEVLYTYDGNPINSKNTNIFVVAEKPLVDWKARMEEMASGLLAERKEDQSRLMKANIKIDELKTERTKLIDKIKELTTKKPRSRKTHK